VLANFGVYTKPPHPPFWPQYLRLVRPHDPSPQARITRRLLDNADTAAQAHLRRAVRHQQQTAAAAAATEQGVPTDAESALHALVPELRTLPTDAAPADEAHPASDDADDDGTAPTATDVLATADDDHALLEHQLLQPDPAVLALLEGTQAPLDDAASAALRAAFEPTTQHADVFTTSALAALHLSPAAAAAAAPHQPPAQPAGFPTNAPGVLPAASVDVAALTHLQRGYQTQLQRALAEMDDSTLLTTANDRRRLHLRNARTPHVHAILTTLPADAADRPENWQHQPIAAGSTPPYVLLPHDELPSPEDVAVLFTLSPDQAPPFLLLAYTLLAEGNGVKQDPLGMITTGDPGTGKTRIILAFLWLAFQHRLSSRILVTSYMWRAAMQVCYTPAVPCRPPPATCRTHLPTCALRTPSRSAPPPTSAPPAPPCSRWATRASTAAA
jgi:hypothetical protein